MVCLDIATVMGLGKEQAWRCMLCNATLELGSEEVTFVGRGHQSQPFPVLVHGECRTGIRLRLGLVEFWDTLEPEQGKAARQRYERMETAVEEGTVGDEKPAPGVVTEVTS